MNWNEALHKINKNEPEPADITLFGWLVGFCCYNDNERFGERVKKYWISSWLEDDGELMVGLAAYYLDDRLVAVSQQENCLREEQISIISKDAFLSIQDLIIELMIAERQPPKPFDFYQELDEEWFSDKEWLSKC